MIQRLVSKLQIKTLLNKNQDILRMFWPVLTEQTLSVLIGMISVIMVSGVGDFAVSGVNMVDNVNFMVIAVFTAFATGATVVVAHKIGAQKFSEAGQTALQSIVMCVITASIIGVAVIIGGRAALQLLFGDADNNVLEAASVYFLFSGISYPFLGLFSTCTGVMRAGGNTRTPMITSIIANVINIIVAFVLIHLGMGVLGASIAMLGARVVSGISTLLLLKRGVRGFTMPRFQLRLSLAVLNPVLKIGVPSGVDSMIFNGARVVLIVFMSGMGTAALHANAIANSLNTFIALPGNALIIVSTTIIGQAYGARQYYKVRRSMIRFCIMSSAVLFVMFVLTWFLADPIISLYAPSVETAELARKLVLTLAILAPIMWGFAFCVPQMLRACGDAKFTMYISVCSLIALRVAGGWFFGIYLGLGVYGVWMGMFIDWFGRGTGFIIRALSNAWSKGQPIVDN